MVSQRAESVVNIHGSIRLLLVPVGMFALIAVSAPIKNALLHGLWLAASVALFGWVAMRVWRAGVNADNTGIKVRNLGRTYVIPWAEVASIRSGGSDNVTGAVSNIVVHRTDGSRVIARPASSYSSKKVERWRRAIEGTRPES